MTNYQEEMTDYLNTVVDALYQQGVRQAVISPGSRSTPLALLLHRYELIETTVGVDERSAAFFALGKSLSSQEPVVLLCTSGTAAANYYPAICEAFESCIPLIVLTTDRPHELRHVGAPQTMDQQALYGNHVKAFLDFSLPENSEEMLNYAFWQTSRLTSLAKQNPRGPVQLNFPLREPLLPDLERQVPDMTHFKAVISGVKSLSREQLNQLAQLLSGKKILVVIGGAHTPKEAKELLQVAQRFNWPVIADPLVNALNCGFQTDLYISHADLMIPFISKEMNPDLVLRIGSYPISKEVMLYLKKLKKPTYWLDEMEHFADMLKQSDVIIQSDLSQFLEMLKEVNLTPSTADWTNRWVSIHTAVSDICSLKETNHSLTEIEVSQIVFRQMPPYSQLFLSNSLSIRHIDRFAQSLPYEFQVFGNRGVNGIDGIVSSAMGMASCQANHQSVLLTGDLTLYHDMNGMLWAKQQNIPLTIVLLNNQGGGIFSYLPQQTLDKSDFEPLFGTPLEIDFKDVAQLYGASYDLVSTKEELETCLNRHVFQLIEIRTNRDANVSELEQIKNKVKEICVNEVE